MPSELSVTFYGCRGSLPVSGPEHTRYGGATSCLVVRAGDRDIVFDAGSGIVNYGRDLLAAYGREQRPITTYLFFTHTHFDHLIGLPYFQPMYMADSTVYLWGPRSSRFQSFQDAIETLVQAPYYPVELHEMHSLKLFHDFGEADVVYFLKDQEEPLQLRPRHPRDARRLPDPERIETEVHCMRGYNHPKSGVSIYKVIHGGRSVVYATDTEGFVQGDRRLMQFAQDADVLIHDAMYLESRYISMPVPTQGYGHSTVEIATDMAKNAGVKQLFLFHHDPTSTDDDLDEVEAVGKARFANTAVARDGLRYSVIP